MTLTWICQRMMPQATFLSLFMRRKAENHEPSTKEDVGPVCKGQKSSSVEEFKKAMRQMETSLGESYKYRECSYTRKRIPNFLV